MKIILALFALSLMIGCGQQENTEQPAPSSDNHSADDSSKSSSGAKTDPTTAEQDHSGHDHAQANPDGYIEVETKDTCSQPTVTYFFAYQCPHCFELEKFTAGWLKTKPDNVKFVSVPTDLGRQEFGPFLLVHHAAEKLNVLSKVKPVLFDMIHNQKKFIQSLEAAIEILTSVGVAKPDAEAALKDEAAMLEKLKANYDTNVRYKITGVPAVMVNYQYKTGPVEAKGYENVFDVVNKTLKLPSNCFE